MVEKARQFTERFSTKSILNLLIKQITVIIET